MCGQDVMNQIRRECFAAGFYSGLAVGIIFMYLGLLLFSH